MDERWELAELNVMQLRWPLDHPRLAPVLAAVDRLNALADASPGFVWRLPAPDGHFHPFGADPRCGATLSVWRAYPDLHRFTYRSAHGVFTKHRREWFQPVGGPTTVLWWIPAGQRPTLDDGRRRLDRLRQHGPNPAAFSLLRQFDAHGRAVGR